MGTRRALRVAVAAALAVGVLVQLAPAGAETLPEPPTSPCAHHSYGSCLLPYPSERWIVADPSSATGVGIDVPADVLPERVLAQLGPGVTIEDAFGDADGFSPLTPVVFELPAPIDPRTLPADGGDALVVYDVTAGTRVPVRAEISRDADRLGATDRIVMAWPATRFEYGHRILAVLTDDLGGRKGVPLDRAPGLDDDARLRADLAAVAPDVPWGGVLSATTFVVRSLANITADVDAMAAIVRSQDHPLRGVRVGPSILGGAAALTGQVQVSDFRDADGIIGRGDAIAATPRWVDFTMVLPAKPAGPNGAPIAIYGHGITAFKETMLVVAEDNARKGVATVGIDVPNHGSRQDEGGFLLDSATPRRFGRLMSMTLQGELDALSLLLALQQHTGDLDPMPYDWFTGRSGDGVPDLDPTRILYEGTSMGGILGASFTALAPELDGSFLQVAGSGILDTIFHSLIWPLFMGVQPAGASAGDAHALVAVVAQFLDRSDNTHLLDRIVAAGTPVWLAYAADDGVVPNTSTDRMLTLLGLPVTGPTTAPVPVGQPRVSAMPASGFGATQIPTGYLWDHWAQPLLTHVAFVDRASTEALGTWLDQRLESTAAPAT